MAEKYISDHILKDKILKDICAPEASKSVFTDESVSNFFKISKERAAKLLKEIHEDAHCSKDKLEFKYRKNDDTCAFIKNGGYTKIARKEYWANFPKDKWYLLDPIKFVFGALVGAAITITIQQLKSSWKESPSNKEKSQPNKDSVDKEHHVVQL